MAAWRILGEAGAVVEVDLATMLKANKMEIIESSKKMERCFKSWSKSNKMVVPDDFIYVKKGRGNGIISPQLLVSMTPRRFNKDVIPGTHAFIQMRKKKKDQTPLNGGQYEIKVVQEVMPEEGKHSSDSLSSRSENERIVAAIGEKREEVVGEDGMYLFAENVVERDSSGSGGEGEGGGDQPALLPTDFSIVDLPKRPPCASKAASSAYESSPCGSGTLEDRGSAVSSSSLEVEMAQGGGGGTVWRDALVSPQEAKLVAVKAARLLITNRFGRSVPKTFTPATTISNNNKKSNWKRHRHHDGEEASGGEGSDKEKTEHRGEDDLNDW
jgi:hypothetical protein